MIKLINGRKKFLNVKHSFPNTKICKMNSIAINQRLTTSKYKMIESMESLNLDLVKSKNGKVDIIVFKQLFRIIVMWKKKRNLSKIVAEILSSKINNLNIL